MLPPSQVCQLAMHAAKHGMSPNGIASVPEDLWADQVVYLFGKLLSKGDCDSVVATLTTDTKGDRVWTSPA